MNLAVHGLEENIQKAITYYEDPHELVGKADYVMANPPFNVDEIGANKVKTNPRLPFGLPCGYCDVVAGIKCGARRGEGAAKSDRNRRRRHHGRDSLSELRSKISCGVMIPGFPPSLLRKAKLRTRQKRCFGMYSGFIPSCRRRFILMRREGSNLIPNRRQESQHGFHRR